jgi:hypothetical protein
MRLEHSLRGGFILRQAQDEESKWPNFGMPIFRIPNFLILRRPERAVSKACASKRAKLWALAQQAKGSGRRWRGALVLRDAATRLLRMREETGKRKILTLSLSKGALALIACLLAAGPALAYPLYGSEDTGIKRLEQARLAHEDKLEGGRKKVSGELLSVEQVDLRLLGNKDLDLPAPDPAFTAQIRALLGENTGRYGISVLDLTDLGKIRYAEHNGGLQQNPGSVGKIAVATGLFQTLADLYPEIGRAHV